MHNDQVAMMLAIERVPRREADVQIWTSQTCLFDCNCFIVIFVISAIFLGIDYHIANSKAHTLQAAYLQYFNQFSRAPAVGIALNAPNYRLVIVFQQANQVTKSRMIITFGSIMKCLLQWLVNTQSITITLQHWLTITLHTITWHLLPAIHTKDWQHTQVQHHQVRSHNLVYLSLDDVTLHNTLLCTSGPCDEIARHALQLLKSLLCRSNSCSTADFLNALGGFKVWWACCQCSLSVSLPPCQGNVAERSQASS